MSNQQQTVDFDNKFFIVAGESLDSRFDGECPFMFINNSGHDIVYGSPFKGEEVEGFTLFDPKTGEIFVGEWNNLYLKTLDWLEEMGREDCDRSIFGMYDASGESRYSIMLLQGCDSHPATHHMLALHEYPNPHSSKSLIKGIMYVCVDKKPNPKTARKFVIEELFDEMPNDFPIDPSMALGMLYDAACEQEYKCDALLDPTSIYDGFVDMLLHEDAASVPFRFAKSAYPNTLMVRRVHTHQSPQGAGWNATPDLMKYVKSVLVKFFGDDRAIRCRKFYHIVPDHVLVSYEELSSIPFITMGDSNSGLVAYLVGKQHLVFGYASDMFAYAVSYLNGENNVFNAYEFDEETLESINKAFDPSIDDEDAADILRQLLHCIQPSKGEEDVTF